MLGVDLYFSGWRTLPFNLHQKQPLFGDGSRTGYGYPECDAAACYVSGNLFELNGNRCTNRTCSVLRRDHHGGNRDTRRERDYRQFDADWGYERTTHLHCTVPWRLDLLGIPIWKRNSNGYTYGCTFNDHIDGLTFNVTGRFEHALNGDSRWNLAGWSTNRYGEFLRWNDHDRFLVGGYGCLRNNSDGYAVYRSEWIGHAQPVCTICG